MQLKNQKVINKKHFKQGGVKSFINRMTDNVLDYIEAKIFSNRNLAILMALYIIAFGFEFLTMDNKVHAEVTPKVEVVETPLVSNMEVDKKAEEVNTFCHPSKNPEVNSLINKYFTDCKEARTIWAIAQSESGGKQLAINKNNRNGSWDCGWVQANTIHKKKGETYQAFCDRMMHLEENVKMAKHVKDIQGWTAWVNYNNECYLAYMQTPALDYSTCKKQK